MTQRCFAHVSHIHMKVKVTELVEISFGIHKLHNNIHIISWQKFKKSRICAKHKVSGLKLKLVSHYEFAVGRFLYFGLAIILKLLSRKVEGSCDYILLLKYHFVKSHNLHCIKASVGDFSQIL